MTELLAPNGKPSNLSPEQYKLVRTPEFKAWFGDWENDPETASKVLDENGEPLVVYHGTNKNIVVFDFDKTQKNDYGYVGKGMYFTPNKQHALAYAEREQYKSIWSNTEKDISSKAIVINCFLCIKNPKLVDRDNNFNNLFYSVIGELEKKEISSNITFNLKEKGFDGVIWHRDNCNGCFEGRKHWEYITYNSQQIKLSDGTNTTFDGGNPDIRFDEGGLTLSEVETRVDNFLQWFENNGWKELSQEEVINEGIGNVDDYFWIEGYTFKSPDKNVLLQFSTQARYILDKHGVFQKIYSRYRDKEPIIMLDTLLVKEKGKGEGTKTIKLITELADKFGVILHLYSKPIPKMEYLNNKELFDFYKKAGFEVLKENEIQKIMVYNPDIRFDNGGELYSKRLNQKFLNHFKNNMGFNISDIPKELINKYPIWKYGTLTYSNEIEDDNIIYAGIEKGRDLNDISSWSLDSETAEAFAEKYDDAEVVELTPKQFRNSFDFVSLDVISDYLYANGLNTEETDEYYSELEIYAFPKKVKSSKNKSNPDISFDGGGETNKKFIEAEVKETIYHRSNPIFREIILKKGLIPKGKSESWLSDTPIEGEVIFAINSSDISDAWDSGYDDDTYEIDTTQLNNKWYLDPNFGSDENNRIITFEPIPVSAIKLVYEGSGESLWKNGGEVIINPTEIECHKCHWHWKVKDGGDDLFICHKCYTDNSKYYKFEGLEGQKILDTISYKKGGKTISQTPAPKKDQIKGSDKNKEGSSKDLKSAKKIELSDKTIESIKNKVDKHNEKYPNKKITIDSAKAVVRRGMGAYSSSYRPTISGGKPNSRVAWGLARLNAFLYKIVNGKSKSGKYSQDNDLIEELGYKVQKFSDGGELNDFVLYHGTGNAKKVIEALKNDSFIFHKSAGVEDGINLTSNKKIALDYANDTNGEDIGVLEIRFNKIPNFKTYNNAGEQYYDEKKYSSNPKEASIEYKKDLIKNNYDGYSTDEVYVLFKEKIDLIDINKSSVLYNYSDSGDIQAYKDAMGISEFDEGGETKPKKVYVSIKLQSKRDNVINEDGIWRGDKFTRYEQKTFEELKNHQLIGIRGVSLSPNNVGDWFSYKDCLVVMNYDEFFKLNDATKVKYDDPYQLMANDLKIFNRLYGNSEYNDEKEKKIKRRENLQKIIEKIPFYFDKAKYEYYYDDAQKRDELQRYYYILGNYKDNFIRWIIDNEYIINSPNDLTIRLIEFAHLPNSESGIDNYRNFNLEKYVLSAEDIFPIIMKGLIKAGSTYTDEAEVIINNKLLNLPNKTQLFFKKEDFENSDLQDLIDKYELEKTYRVYSIKSQYIKEYQDKLLVSRTKRDISKWELGKEQLEIKKELVLNDLQKLFFDKSLDKINKILDEKYPSTYYFEWEGEETKYFRWNEVIEVQFLLNKFFEITLRDWKSVFITKKANEIYSMSFYGIYNSIEHFLRQFIEQNRDYLENINKYHNENGDYLWLYDIERAVLGVVSTTWDEENGISHNELAKKYFQMIGGELTTYYKQDEIVMPSIYKDGGEAEEPTYFWGTEAGGVLVYCSKTERYLILLRSEWVLEPNTWGIISGKLDDKENVQEAVLREAEEETGHKLGHLIPSFVFEKPNFKFHNFVSIVDEEFVPELNWENTDYKWVKLNDMPDNLHFGLKILIEKEDLPKLVQKNNTMNTNNPKDTITMDIPLLIRYSELMREDVKSDVALHEIVENLLEIKDKGVLTMDDYESVIANVIGTEETPEQVIQPEEEKMSEGGKLNSIKSKKGDIKISLGEDWYSDDSSVELVPVSELVKFREFDRKVKPKYNQDNSRDNINHLKYMFQKDGVKEPLIIEYSANDNAVIVIEGNHRINSAIDLGMEYLPARVVLKKYSAFTPNQLKNTMKVKGVNADQSGYISSDLKPSQVGIEGAMPIYADGGIIEGRLHSECGDDGCGRKFQVGENGHIIEAERDEAVIVADAFDDEQKYTIEGTPSEVASALNVMGGGKNFDRGAIIVKNGEELEIPELKKQAIDTDVDDILDPNSIIINRRSMADSKKYEVTGTPKQIASAINSLNGNGVVIERGAEIKEN
jgi:8-oxo-dGTP pyrophosphatase MutT (NUDIX family)